MKITKDSKGITLIALIITIMILIILAGISISLIIGENGIINYAQQGEEKTKQEQAREKLSLAISDLFIEKQGKLMLEQLDEITQNGISIKMTSDMSEVEIQEKDNRKYAIAYVDGYIFEVYDNLEIILTGEGEELDKGNISDYVQNGLIVLYDGIENTKNGHSMNTDIWENLVENGELYNGTLKKVNFNSTSGWTKNSLILDGVDDWVQMEYLYNENITIEIVVKPITIQSNKKQYYLSNAQNGGTGIWTKSNLCKGGVYINLSYQEVISDEMMQEGKIYSISTGCNQEYQYLSENGRMYKQEVTEIYRKPDSTTKFVIATNPDGSGEALLSGDARSNIEVYSVRIYNRCLTEEEIQHNCKVDQKRFNIKNMQNSEQGKFGYVEDGLLCLLDGEQNTNYGHNNITTVWKDLSGNNNTAMLQKIDFNSTSGWTKNSLILDGVDDWVQMKYLYNENTTIEIVTKPITVKSNSQQYLTNFEDGGIGIKTKGSKFIGQAYIGGYKMITSENDVEAGKIYSLSTGYNGSEQYFRENEKMYKNIRTGKLGNPGSETIFAIGTNPKGSGENILSGESRCNIEVYSVRIYNRCLTEEEIQHNYEIDKQRYGIKKS